MKKRAFVLDPLKDLQNDFVKEARQLKQHSPLWMAILNVTPNSFSDGGQFKELKDFTRKIKEFDDLGVQILDIGAESTGPQVQPIDGEEEWRRLAPYLKALDDTFSKGSLGPLVSVDTYRAETAQKSIQWGADIINDVSAMMDPEMINVLKRLTCAICINPQFGCSR